MMPLFSDQMRRDPYPVYAELRARSPLHYSPPPFNAWMLLDYEGVRRALTDHKTFGSRVPGPKNWFIFSDPPAHSKLRALIARAFTPGMLAGIEPHLRALSGALLDAAMDQGEMDLAQAFSTPLAMQAIAGIIGIPAVDWQRYRRWSDVIVGLSNVRFGGGQSDQALHDFATVSAEMSAYLVQLIAQRRSHPRDDLLTHLIEAEIDGERLFHEEILGFLQLLVVGGQETTSDLINNAVLCLLEHPDQLALLRTDGGLLASAIEEVLRYRSPTQWITRVVRQEVRLHGTTIPAGGFVVPVIGAANRDPAQFANPDHFDIRRSPSPHVGFGHGVHFCLGAALSRLEAKVALSEFLARVTEFELATDQPLEPRHPVQVLGPARLPIRFRRR